MVGNACNGCTKVEDEHEEDGEDEDELYLGSYLVPLSFERPPSPLLVFGSLRTTLRVSSPALGSFCFLFRDNVELDDSLAVLSFDLSFDLEVSLDFWRSLLTFGEDSL